MKTIITAVKQAAAPLEQAYPLGVFVVVAREEEGGLRMEYHWRAPDEWELPAFVDLLATFANKIAADMGLPRQQMAFALKDAVDHAGEV
jgi:hypothetical protein